MEQIPDLARPLSGEAHIIAGVVGKQVLGQTFPPASAMRISMAWIRDAIRTELRRHVQNRARSQAQEE